MKQQAELSSMSDDELLKLRFCDLDIRIKGTWLEECVDQLYKELEAKAIPFKPQCFLADEWLTPENEPVVGIPFYLASPRLMDLEKKMIGSVEGGDKTSCMKLLRHETGHAINYAYSLYKAKKWRHLFGHFFEEYPDRYKFRPYSKNFVIHLDEWYAQYHPDEDFAETFAVWLTPDSGWQEKYKGWKALDKLQYVDEIMKGMPDRQAVKKTGKKHWRISSLKSTLATHYKRKTEFYAEDSPDFHAAELKKIFPAQSQPKKQTAFRFLNKYKKDILNAASHWTGERKYIVQRLLKNLIERSRELSLDAPKEDTQALMMVTAYITSLVMNYVYTGRFKRKK